MKRTIFLLVVLCAQLFSLSQKKTPLPTKYQLQWHEMEFYLFVHFGPNTFTNKEWGEGTEPEDIFNPAELDTRQWCRTAKAAGAKAIIITAKHHDGFCLWPSKFSKHTVRESKWKNGQGDVLKELSRACREFGLKFGVYISPWDRNHPKYGTSEYNDVFVNMLKELFTNYGPIWELWWDGANGEGPNGKKQIYDWNRYKQTVRRLSPSTVIFSDVGPDIRWVGNEKGIAGMTNWNYLNTDGFTPGLGSPPVDTLNQGNVHGRYWIPAECDVSIRPGWFYHPEEDDKIKTPAQLFQLYLKSVGRGANLLLNVPPDRKGLITTKDSLSLIGFRKLKDENFKDNLLKQANTYYEFSPQDLHFRNLEKDGAFGANLQNFVVQLPQSTKINCLVLREAIHLGQTIRKFRVQFFQKNQVIHELAGTTIGRKRILTFPEMNITSFKVFLDDAQGSDNVSGIAAYLIDSSMIEK